MLRFLHGDELSDYPLLRDTMFSDRAGQFRDRLGWEVSVDENGWERDEYDEMNPLYVIWQQPDGRHGGSMRFLPTRGRTMVNDHFAHLIPQGRIEDHRIWECTRFCLSAEAETNVSVRLMLGGAELGLGFGLSHAVGVFDARMVRIYRLLGWAPEIIGKSGEGRNMIGLGLWSYSKEVRDRMAERAEVPVEQSELWFARAFGLRRTVAA
jgi:acyl homoserine lactone synthase